MKNSKKLIALVLAMVMIFALTASALAATDSTNNTIEVTVSVIKRYPSGMTPILSETVTLPSNATAYNAVQVFLDSQATKTTYPRVSDAVWKVVPVVDENGSTLDDAELSSVKLSDLELERQDYISLRIGVHADAEHVGGLNLFGEKFGDFAQGIVARIGYAK